MLNPKVFKAYDIRGIYPDEIDEEGFKIIVQAIITYLKKTLKKENPIIAVGCDARKSSPQFFEIAKKTAVEYGITLIDIGLTTTPTFYFAVLKYGYDAGFMITASHNPKDYNGAKIVIRENNKLIKIGKGSGMEEIKEIALNQNFSPSKNQGKIIKNNQVLNDEAENALSHLDLKKLKKFKIVIDPANGMASLYLKKFFEKIPAEIIWINEEIDCSFPNHEANPLKFETLKDLQKKVVEEKADFGIAPDGDGDRIFFIDEKGQIIPATMITSMIAEEILKNNHNETIVVDVRYINNVINTVKKNGGKIDFTKVGHAFITQKLTEVNGIFAGESSGHFFFRETGFAESSILVLTYFLKIISQKNQPVSQVWKNYYTSFESGEVNFKLKGNLTGKQIQEKISQDYQDGEISWLDGISCSYKNWRFNIRSSNTEPLLRLNIESESKKLTEEKLKELSRKIISLGAEQV